MKSRHMHCQACGRKRWGAFDGEEFTSFTCGHVTHYDLKRNQSGWWSRYKISLDSI